jgi:capsular exopolysaccharide synthesis family protein
MDSADPQAPSQPFLASLGVKAYRYRALLKRHWWVLAITVAIGLGYQGYRLATKPQLFQSDSRLIIRAEMISEPQGGFRSDPVNYFGTVIEQLKTPSVISRAYSRVALEAPQATGTVEVTASQLSRSDMFVVTGIGTNPDYTQRYLDAIVAELLAMREAERRGVKTEVAGGLADEIKALNSELEEQKAKLQEFIEKNNMAFWQEQGKSAALFLSGLKNQQASLQNELQRIDNLTPDQLLSSAPQFAPPTKAASASPVAAQQNNSFNGELYTAYIAKTQELVQKQAELAERGTVWKPKHPRLQALQAEVERIERTIKVIREQNTEATRNRAVAIKAELKSLDASIQTWETKVLEASRKDAEYQTRQSDVARTSSQLEKLRGSRSGIDIGSRMNPDPLVVFQTASPAIEVPRGIAKHLITGLLAGLVFGIGILVIIDRSDDRLASSTELIQQFSEPILAQIPNVSASRNATGLPLLQEEDDRYAYAEAFRSLRSSLIFMPNQTELKAILITSAIPNEGKSTLASNLAITMAAAGARVLLVDADLRRGDLSQLFDTDGKIGLSSILRGETDWKSAIQATKIPTLSLIPRGPVTNQSGELLLKPILVSLLEEFRGSYDLTIFNTAPILATDDTPTIAPHFDGSIMVMRAGFTSARLTRNAVQALYQRQVNVLGIILNCVDAEMPDYYYYRYPKYYAA